MNLDAVRAGFERALRAVRKHLHKRGGVVRRHLVKVVRWELVETGGLDFFRQISGAERIRPFRQRNRRTPNGLARSRIGDQATEMQLNCELGAMGVHGVRDAPDAWDIAVIGYCRLVRHIIAEWVADADDPHCDQRRAAFGDALIEGEYAVAASAVSLGVSCAHRRQQHTVSQLHRADAARREKILKTRHGTPLICIGRPAACAMWRGRHAPPDLFYRWIRE